MAIDDPKLFRYMPPLGEGKKINERRTTCAICGKEITPADAANIEYIRRRNGPDLWVHTECILRSST